MIISSSRAVSQSRAEQECWPTTTLGSHLELTATQSPDHLAVVDGQTRISYGDLLGLVNRLARAFQSHGLTRHGVVTIDLPNWWEALVSVHAALRVGAIPNPVIPIYREHEVGFILRQADPRVVVIPHHFRSHDYVRMLENVLSTMPDPPIVVVVRPEGPLPAGFISFDTLLADGDTPGAAADPVPDSAEPDDIALLLYTSGTTADPKGVLHNHRTLGYENQSIIDLFRLGQSDTVFMASPVTHITGFLYGVLLPPMLGVPSVLLDIWDPDIAAVLIEQEACRFTVGATPFLEGIASAYQSRGHHSALNVFLCGGADVPPHLVYESIRILGSAVHRVYGSSEFPTFSCGGPSDPIEVSAETDGRAIGVSQCRIEGANDEGTGELLVRGPEMFLGYLDQSLNQDAFTEDGYFHTGDLARLHASGAVIIEGRKKDIIVRNGENLSSKEIEDILYEHPSVREVAVVAMPSARTGEAVCAFIVPVDGAQPSLEDLCAHLQDRRIARQKFPERLELIAALPTTASGKVQKFVLRDLVRGA
jgi:cyclohexanecarboxylate-CoA ligase